MQRFSDHDVATLLADYFALRLDQVHPGEALARSAAPSVSLGADSRARAEEMQAMIERRGGSRPAFTLEQAPQVPPLSAPPAGLHEGAGAART